MTGISVVVIALVFSGVLSTLHGVSAIESAQLEEACNGGMMSGILHPPSLTLRSNLDCMVRCAGDVNCEAATWEATPCTCTFYESYWCAGAEQVQGLIARRRKVRVHTDGNKLITINPKII